LKKTVKKVSSTPKVFGRKVVVRRGDRRTGNSWEQGSEKAKESVAKHKEPCKRGGGLAEKGSLESGKEGTAPRSKVIRGRKNLGEGNKTGGGGNKKNPQGRNKECDALYRTPTLRRLGLTVGKTRKRDPLNQVKTGKKKNHLKKPRAQKGI